MKIEFEIYEIKPNDDYETVSLKWVNCEPTKEGAIKTVERMLSFPSNRGQLVILESYSQNHK